MTVSGQTTVAEKMEAARKVVAEWLDEHTLPAVVARDCVPPDLARLSDILAVVGPRRAGKTFFMFQLMHDLLGRSGVTKADILYVDFEDYRLMDFTARDVEHLFVAFNQFTAHYPTYIFFDEVQNLSGWSRVLRTLHNQRRYKLVISGSNSKLLSGEIATELRGRYVDLLILPFSFPEALRLKKLEYSERSFHTATRGRLLRAFDEYLSEGGFPEVLQRSSSLEKKQLLQNYYRTIFYRDILERHNVRARSTLDLIMRYCLNTYSELFSITAFDKHLKAHDLPTSKRTIANYLGYLSEAFFLLTHEKFSFSPRKRLMNPRKIYLLDVGFTSLSTDFSPNRGKILENVVAIELLRRQEETFYHREKQECDFLIRRRGKPAAAVQVCWQLTEKTQERELNGLVDAMTLFNLKRGFILTYDQEQSLLHKGFSVRVLPVWKWLLRKEETLG